MKKIMTMLSFALCGLSLVADSAAFTYQAKLKERTGELSVTNANLSIEIRLYRTADGDDVLWGRLFNVLTDAQGNFNLLVSDDGSVLNGTPATARLAEVMKAQQAGEIYLGLTVVNPTAGGATADEIKPRQRIFAVPFAAVANDVRAISGDVAVDGRIKFGADDDGVIISKDGIKQTSAKGVETPKLTVSGTTSVGAFAAGGTVLQVNGDGVKVTGKDLALTNATVKVNGSELLPVPVGGIIMWSKDEPPEGGEWANSHWAICDGQNGTPNLTNRFVVAAAPAGKGQYRLGDQGGANEVTLTVDQMPKHSHEIYLMSSTWSCLGGGLAVYTPNGNNNRTLETGGGQSHENRPPYYALYYIMRMR